MNFFKEKQVRIVSLKENFDSSTPQGRLAIGLFQLVSHEEKEPKQQKSDKMKRFKQFFNTRFNGGIEMGLNKIIKAIMFTIDKNNGMILLFLLFVTFTFSTIGFKLIVEFVLFFLLLCNFTLKLFYRFE